MATKTDDFAVFSTPTSSSSTLLPGYLPPAVPQLPSTSTGAAPTPPAKISDIDAAFGELFGTGNANKQTPPPNMMPVPPSGTNYLGGNLL